MKKVKNTRIELTYGDMALAALVYDFLRWLDTHRSVLDLPEDKRNDAVIDYVLFDRERRMEELQKKLAKAAAKAKKQGRKP